MEAGAHRVGDHSRPCRGQGCPNRIITFVGDAGKTDTVRSLGFEAGLQQCPRAGARRVRLTQALVIAPRERPSTGKIAVTVIYDYGDEVMKVFEA